MTANNNKLPDRTKQHRALAVAYGLLYKKTANYKTTHFMLSFQYLKDEDDSFTVDFYKGYDFPQTLYHFCHSNEEEQVFIEKNEDFQFNTEMVETAKAFVKKVYGIDCSEADVHAYGYANKVSVQLNVAANVIFQVRFYYKDDVPVGVLFFTEQEYATGAMKANKAALLYSDTAH